MFGQPFGAQMSLYKRAIGIEASELQKQYHCDSLYMLLWADISHGAEIRKTYRWAKNKTIQIFFDNTKEQFVISQGNLLHELLVLGRMWPGNWPHAQK